MRLRCRMRVLLVRQRLPIYQTCAEPLLRAVANLNLSGPERVRKEILLRILLISPRAAARFETHNHEQDTLRRNVLDRRALLVREGELIRSVIPKNHVARYLNRAAFIRETLNLHAQFGDTGRGGTETEHQYGNEEAAIQNKPLLRRTPAAAIDHSQTLRERLFFRLRRRWQNVVQTQIHRGRRVVIGPAA